MTRHFVAVGGSGQHVALALADFLVLAHSVTPDPLPPVDFLLLDSDQTSTQTDTPSAWQLADEQLRTLAQVPDRAAGAPLGRPEAAIPKLREGVRTAREAVDDVLGVGTSDLLLSASQMEVPVMNGYYGEPRVAAILTDVLLDHLHGGRLQESHPLRLLQSAVIQPDARICVAGSTIGGTGAGVLPRLVEELGSADNRKAALAALLALQWFKLDGDTEKEERIAANGAASLWHYIQNQARGRYRLILWGHPQVGQARRERPFGNRSQGAKVDLTAPYYAAAAAAAFLFGDEQKNERVAGVATPGTFTLPEQLQFTTGIDLHWLLVRNADLIGRLQLLNSYLRGPYTGYVMPFFRSACRVPEIDSMSPAARTALAAQVDAVVRAKTRALDRLRAFATDLNVPRPRAWSGIPNLRSWLRRVTPALSVFPALLPEISLLAQNPSPLRALPAEATVHAEFSQDPVGTRAPLLNTHVDALAQFPRVDGTRVPDAHGIDIVLQTAFDNPATYWQVGGERLASLLTHQGGPALPPELGTVGSDGYVAWVQRWFLLVSGLCSGALTVRRLDRPVLGITHALVLSSARDEVPVGYLHADLFCVPNLSAFWSSASAVAGLHDRIGAVRSVVGPWLRTLIHAGECRHGGGTRPTWTSLLEEAFGDDVPTNGMADPARTVPLAWRGAERNVDLPLPAREGSDTPLADAMAAAFNLPIQYLRGPAPEFSAEELSLWRSLNAARVEVGLVRDEDTWHELQRTSVIWIDRLAPETSRALDGNVHFHPGRGYAWKVEGGAQSLTIGDVLTPVVAVFHPEVTAPVATWPVRGRYAGLIEDCRADVHVDGTVEVHLTLRGRGEVNHIFTPGYVKRYPSRVTIFSWPKASTNANGSHSLLFSTDGPHFVFRILYGRGPGDIAVASAPLREAGYPQYLTPSENGVPQGAQPLAISLKALDVDGGSQEVGLLPYRVVNRSAAGQREQWAVDLGTSSTVIARRGGAESEATIVYPTEERDATQVYSMGHGVDHKALSWFPTWSDKRPHTSRTCLMPSQVVDYGIVGRTYVPRELQKRVFGRDYVLDHGEEIDEGYESAIVDDLKWRRDDKQIYRSHYLAHLLEQSLSMELSARGSMPPELDVTFTLPLRQRDDLPRFAGEIKDVTERVARRTGIALRPLFQWESVAIAPRFLGTKDGVVVVADLGGGTLDLYAAQFKDAGKIAEAVDSAYLGGHECAKILHKKRAFGEASLASVLRTIRSGNYDKRDVASKIPEARDYFEILYRYIAAWTATLRAKWSVPEETPVDLQLAGLGWSLPGCPDRQADVATQLTQAARALKMQFGFRSFGPEYPEAEGRKLRLARDCAHISGVDLSEIMKTIDRLDIVLGVDVYVNGTLHPATTTTRELPLSTNGAVRADERSARTVLPSLSDVNLSELARRLSTRTDVTDRKRGAIDTVTGSLAVTPLTSAAEIAVNALVVAQ